MQVEGDATSEEYEKKERNVTHEVQEGCPQVNAVLQNVYLA